MQLSDYFYLVIEKVFNSVYLQNRCMNLLKLLLLMLHDWW